MLESSISRLMNQEHVSERLKEALSKNTRESKMERMHRNDKHYWSKHFSVVFKKQRNCEPTHRSTAHATYAFGLFSRGIYALFL